MRTTLFTLALAALALAACSSSPTSMTPSWPYPQVPADPQRAGDPTAGYDYLINGGYITCGIPKPIYDQFAGQAAAADRLPGRTGANATLPYYYSAAMSPEGVEVVSANCLTCHAGRINGQLVVGLGASDRDFTTDQTKTIDALGGFITDPTQKAEWQRFDDHTRAIGDYTRTLTVGVNPADSLTAALMAHRDPATLAWSDAPLTPLPPAGAVPVDVPPWWGMARKNAMFYTAGGRGDHARIEMAASLLCTDTVAEATAIDDKFIDVRAWIETLSAPAYPFAIDTALAARGKPIFDAACASCHGSYGASADYPNEVVPLADIGTDSLLATGGTEFTAAFVQWFAASFWGAMSRFEPQQGYVAPPLEGVWATAPYLHNGSVPTIEGVLDSTKRPTYWTRIFDSTAYDQAALGWQFAVGDHGQAQEPNPMARVRLYDTTLPGYGNAGHTFGDALSADDRAAVIEYLKTL